MIRPRLPGRRTSNPGWPTIWQTPPRQARGSVKVEIDRLVRPGAVVSGSVTFSDGTAGKWAMDQHGRLMLDTGKKGYQPSPGDVEVFQRELSTQLQRHGF